MESLAYKENYKEEVLNGEVFLMSPKPGITHSIIMLNIYNIFNKYLEDKSCIVFTDSVDVHLSKKDIVVPDITVLCDKNKMKENGIHGVPSLVVEILSPGTSKRDRGYKKDLYEKHGVKEYWIVSPNDFSIEIYTLKEGKYILDNVYEIYPKYYLDEMKKEEKEKIESTIKSLLFKDLEISIEEVFKGVLKEQ